MERSSPPVTGHFSPRELLLGRGQGLTPPLDSPERRRRSAAAVTMTVSRHDSLRRPEDTPIRRSNSGQHSFGEPHRPRAMDADTLAQVGNRPGRSPSFSRLPWQPCCHEAWLTSSRKGGRCVAELSPCKDGVFSGPAGHRGDGHRGPGGTEAAGAAGLQASSRRGPRHSGPGEKWSRHHLLLRIAQPPQHPQHSRDPRHARDARDPRHSWHTEPLEPYEPHEPPPRAYTWTPQTGQPIPRHSGLLQAGGQQHQPYRGPAAAPGAQAQTGGPSQEQHPAPPTAAGQILHYVSQTRPIKERPNQADPGPNGARGDQGTAKW